MDKLIVLIFGILLGYALCLNFPPSDLKKTFASTPHTNRFLGTSLSDWALKASNCKKSTITLSLFYDDQRSPELEGKICEYSSDPLFGKVSVSYIEEDPIEFRFDIGVSDQTGGTKGEMINFSAWLQKLNEDFNNSFETFDFKNLHLAKTSFENKGNLWNLILESQKHPGESDFSLEPKKIILKNITLLKKYRDNIKEEMTKKSMELLKENP